MKIRLSVNSFVRNFGPYTHIYDQRTKFDETYENAEVFMRNITRMPVDFESACLAVISAYDCVTSDEERLISRDFREFVDHLIASGVVVEGIDDGELASRDRLFSYADENPKTEVDLAGDNIESADLDAHALLHKYFEKYPTPYSLHIDLTSECNEHCVHCYVPRQKHFYADGDKVCEVLEQFRQMEGVQVTLSGGECLLHPAFEKILRRARELDLSVSVLSNLTLLTERKAQLLKEMNLALVQVSLYSMNPEVHDRITRHPGSFALTRNAIELLHSLDVPVQISCPCMKENYAGYQDVLGYAYGLKMKAYTDFVMFARSDGTTDNLQHRLDLKQSEAVIRTIMEHELEMKSALENGPVGEPDVNLGEKPMCGVCLESICLNADGNYYPCSGFQGYPVGNCYKQTLQEVWNESAQIAYIRQLKRKDIPQCLECKDAEYCAMCLVRNFNETGSMLKVSPHFCAVAKINHELVDEYRSECRKKCRKN